MHAVLDKLRDAGVKIEREPTGLCIRREGRLKPVDITTLPYAGFPTDAQAQELAKDMMWFWQSWATPFGQGVPELLIGSPDTISRRLDQVKRALPDQDEVVLLIPQGLHERPQILTSLELMAKEVMPRFA